MQLPATWAVTSFAHQIPLMAAFPRAAAAVQAAQAVVSGDFTRAVLKTVGQAANASIAAQQEHYMKGVLPSIGVRNATLRAAWQSTRQTHTVPGVQQAVEDAVSLLGRPEEQMKWLGIELLHSHVPRLGASAFPLVEHLVCAGHVFDWATTDILSSRVLGACLIHKGGMHLPESEETLGSWAAGEPLTSNMPLAGQTVGSGDVDTATATMWLQRAACVALVRPAWRGGCLPLVLRATTAAATNGSRWTNLGIGWLLRSAAKHPQQHAPVLAQVRSLVRAGCLSREGLSYAVRLQPPEVKAQFLAEWKAAQV